MSLIYQIKVRQNALKLEISSKGFTPSIASILLAENFIVNAGELVADIGTGTSIQAIVAAKLGASEVHATDINPYDLSVARRNIRQNNVADIVQLYEGRFLEPVPQLKKFDTVIFNLPQTPIPISRITDPAQIGLYAGGDGTNQVIRGIYQAEKRLVVGGRLYFILDSIANPDRVEAVLRRKFDFRVMASITAPFRLFELELLPVLKRMKKQGKAVFHFKFNVPMYEKRLYECICRN